jgi:hypothetical protein
MQPLVWWAEACLGNGICEAMPTAIVSHFTTSGFVITADGKTTAGSESTQKIFEIKGASAAYALYGNIGFGNDKDDDAPSPLHLGNEIDKLLNSGRIPVGDLMACGRQLADEIHVVILKAKASKLIVYPSGPSDINGVCIANVFLFGYSKDSPLEVDITFRHRDQVLSEPLVNGIDPRRVRNPRVWGDDAVLEFLKSGDHRFARFGGVKLPPKPEEISLLDAAKFGENYVWACDSYEGRNWGDRAICASIGGHIHIAAIMPTAGFHWLKPPIFRP